MKWLRAHWFALMASIGGASALAMLVFGGWGLALLSMAMPKEKIGESVKADVATEVRREIKSAVAVKRVKVYAPEVKQKLGLPDIVVQAKDEQVISTARVPDTGRPHTVTTTINTETGEAQSFVRADPLPWVALERRGEFSLGAGYKHTDRGTNTVGRAAFRHDFLQVKALHLGVEASVDTDRDAYVGARVAYRW